MVLTDDNLCTNNKYPDKFKLENYGHTDDNYTNTILHFNYKYPTYATIIDSLGLTSLQQKVEWISVDKI